MLSDDLDVLSLGGLLRLNARIRSQLRVRGIARTAGSLEGEVSEHLAQRVYGGQLLPPSTKACDLVDARERHVQVKARSLLHGEERMFQFESLDIDVAVCLRFDRDTGDLVWAREFTQEELREQTSDHTSGPRLSTRRAAQSGRDVTTEFRKAYDAG